MAGKEALLQASRYLCKGQCHLFPKLSCKLQRHFCDEETFLNQHRTDLWLFTPGQPNPFYFP